MLIKFRAVESAPQYTVLDSTINGLDLSVFTEGDQFLPESPEAEAAGIADAWRDSSGELHAVLLQSPPVTLVTYLTPTGPVTLTPDAPTPVEFTGTISHRPGAWKSSEWINAATYDPDTLYIQQGEEHAELA